MRGRRITNGSWGGLSPSRDRKEGKDATLQSEAAESRGFECRTGHAPGVVDAYRRCEAGNPVEPRRQRQAHIVARCGIVDKTKYCHPAVEARGTERVSLVVDRP